MHTLTLSPSDTLFFRDGRPMEASLAGNGAAWPLPHIPHQALHAALHRAFPQPVEGEHVHRAWRSGDYLAEGPQRRFGELTSAGPFPIDPEGKWFFPRPADAQTPADTQNAPENLAVSHAPHDARGQSSLGAPLKLPIASKLAPSKEASCKPWLSTAAYQAYLRGQGQGGAAVRDADFADTEHQIGIKIDPITGTTGQGDAAGGIYSAHYLRLRDGWRMGLFAEGVNGPGKVDFLRQLFTQHGQRILVGGQQRLCSVELRAADSLAALPRGLSQSAEFTVHEGTVRLKWVLLTPAIWPEIAASQGKLEATKGRPVAGHPGGWLPNWIDPTSGAVMLRHGIGAAKAARLVRHGKPVPESGPIEAHLVAALVPKPIVVTGWALGSMAASPEDLKAGAKCTHLAVPAGAVYYFECANAEAAVKLAAALNWHGSLAPEQTPTRIANRRSTLLGEKGYGLGVCGTWNPM